MYPRARRPSASPNVTSARQHVDTTRSRSLDSSVSGYSTDSTPGFCTPSIPPANLPLSRLLPSAATLTTSQLPCSERRQLSPLSASLLPADLDSAGDDPFKGMVDVYSGLSRSSGKRQRSTTSPSSKSFAKGADLYDLAAVANGLVAHRRTTAPLPPIVNEHKRSRSRNTVATTKERHGLTELLTGSGDDAKRFKAAHLGLAGTGLAALPSYIVPQPHPYPKAALPQVATIHDQVTNSGRAQHNHRSSAETIHSLLTGLEAKREEDSRSHRSRYPLVNLSPSQAALSAPIPWTTISKMEPPSLPIHYSPTKTPQLPPSSAAVPASEDPLSSQLLTQRTALFFEHIYRDVGFGIFPRAYIYPKIGQNQQKQEPGFAALALSMSVLGLLGARMPVVSSGAVTPTERKASTNLLSPKSAAVSKSGKGSLLEDADWQTPFQPPVMPAAAAARTSGGVQPSPPSPTTTTEQRYQIVSLISFTLSTRALSEGTASFGQQPGCTSIMTSYLLSLALLCLDEAEAKTTAAAPVDDVERGSTTATVPASPTTNWKDASFLRFSESVTLAKILGIDRLALDEEAQGQQRSSLGGQAGYVRANLSVEEYERRIRLWALLVRTERWWATQRSGYQPQLSVPTAPIVPAAQPILQSPLTSLPPPSPPPVMVSSTEDEVVSATAHEAWQQQVPCPPSQPTPALFRSQETSGSIIDWIRSSATISEVTPHRDALQLPPLDEIETSLPVCNDVVDAPSPSSPQSKQDDDLAILSEMGLLSFREIFSSRFTRRDIECWQGRCAAENCHRLDSALALRIDDSLLDLSSSNTSLPIDTAGKAGDREAAEGRRRASLTHRDGILLDLVRQVLRCRLWRASLRHGLIFSSPASPSGSAMPSASRVTPTASTVPPPLRPDQPLHIGLDTLDILEDLHDLVFASQSQTLPVEQAEVQVNSRRKSLVQAFLHEIADCVRAVAQSQYRDETFVLEEEEETEEEEEEEGEEGGEGNREDREDMRATTPEPHDEAGKAKGDDQQGTLPDAAPAGEGTTSNGKTGPSTTTPAQQQSGVQTKTTIQQGSRAILFDLERFFQQVF